MTIKRPLIVGCKGNMGRRYRAILDYLKIPSIGIDQGDPIPDTRDYDGVIVATPTERHAEDVARFSSSGCPILVEKPLSKNLGIVDEVLRIVKKTNSPLRMVNQYQLYPQNPLCDGGWTVYDYWNHGKDGLAWDCISIIALAAGRIRLGETSPVWMCRINGELLSVNGMDQAYVNMIQQWAEGNCHDAGYIRMAHQKVFDYLEKGVD